jgi:hypothetical protein
MHHHFTRRRDAALLLALLMGAHEAARAEDESPNFHLNGYAEAYLQWNANQPSNGITNFRGFDNRHNAFTLSNVALDAQWDDDKAFGRVALQVGPAPSTYYLGEPALPGAGGANATGPELWKYVQQAYLGSRFGDGGTRVEAGLFLSPVGPEGIAIKDNWNWSRSNLFFGLPFYHTGARVVRSLSDSWTATLMLCNGWNSAVDNNDEKSVTAYATYSQGALTTNLLYFGGVERATGATEGEPWRHLFDAHATWQAKETLAFLGHVDAGFEDNEFGTSSWVAGAIYARVEVAPAWFVAARADAFKEEVASNASGSAGTIFWPAEWVASQTLTIDYRPHERASIRLEYRHDQADSDMFFGDDVTGDGVSTPFVANRDAQDTITIGMTGWF